MQHFYNLPLVRTQGFSLNRHWYYFGNHADVYYWLTSVLMSN
ncbi:hypothetical protein GXM_09093 [Nostoc sphaeroides CCNUC1]|uniref:Uncharacterized protein n=1 Tax=Nostoc sphaeroides CCNUC1 TaxID=2653204 RepID=A0A5P8WIF6_9NOSO|nr:hypothetical protein GXM_09093 [Nostoc sphaeroides CCNUC1]